MKLKFFILLYVAFFCLSCKTHRVKIENENKGKLIASVSLETKEEKKFSLDDSTASTPEYSQLYIDHNGKRFYTFLNNYTNYIYFYDYSTTNFCKKKCWREYGTPVALKLKAYYIKSLDSIYLFKISPHEIVSTNEDGQIFHRTNLLLNPKDRDCFTHYPQYLPLSGIPFIETKDKLYVNGFYFGIMSKSFIKDFKFTASLDFRSNQLEFIHSYPEELYGNQANWCSYLLTQVYSALQPDGNGLVLSFPISHNLYISDLKSSEYKKRFGGSNFASTITSLNENKENTTQEIALQHFIENDIYTSILYDKFRKVYYRFLLKASHKDSNCQSFKDKLVVIIIMDENFKYLGETTIGRWENWNWQNSFVTSEGLNVEYKDKDPKEAYLTLKIFTLKKI